MFYNVKFNYLSERGRMKFAWGTAKFDLSSHLLPQIIEYIGFDKKEVFNIDLTAFNSVEVKSNE